MIKLKKLWSKLKVGHSDSAEVASEIYYTTFALVKVH